MHRILLRLLLGIAIADEATEAPKEEDGVLVLQDKNFEGTIKSNPFILVEFYAPWCGHCKQFAPEYAGAAKQLKEAKPPIPLAKVDATTEARLAEDHGIRGYPTIRMFINGKDQEYTGGRTQQSIVTWVLKKAGPPAVPLVDVAQAEAFEKENTLSVVAFFAEGASQDAFEAAARQVEDVMFASTTDPSVAAKYGVTPPGLRMSYPHDEKSTTFTGSMDSAEEIQSFVRAYRQPMVSTFDGETAADIFGDGRAILFLFREKDEKGDAAEAELRKAAIGIQRRLLVSVAGSNEPMDQRLMDYVSVEPEELPTVRLVANPMASMTKYKLEGELTEASITAFVNDFDGQRLKPHLKSEEPPTSQTGPVYTLVGSTFDSIVLDPKKDVLVEFYAPWCGHCKKLEPVFRDVAKILEPVKSLVIAKIDATANDVQGADVEGFPTIKFWPANKKGEPPLDYDSDRDVDSFITWLEEKVTYPFNKDELKTEL